MGLGFNDQKGHKQRPWEGWRCDGGVTTPLIPFDTIVPEMRSSDFRLNLASSGARSKKGIKGYQGYRLIHAFEAKAVRPGGVLRDHELVLRAFSVGVATLARSPRPHPGPEHRDAET